MRVVPASAIRTSPSGRTVLWYSVSMVADSGEVHVVHHRVLHGRLDRRIEILGGDADDGGVQGVHPLAGRIGEGVGDGDHVPAGDPAHRRQLDVDVQFVAGDDRTVLLKDLFGLQVGVVADDHRFEHPAITRHAWGRRERQRRHQSRISQRSGGVDIPVRGVIVLHRAGVLAHLFAADQVGAVHLVVMADPRFERRRFCCCGHECAQLFYRLVRCGRPEDINPRTPWRGQGYRVFDEAGGVTVARPTVSG